VPVSETGTLHLTGLLGVSCDVSGPAQVIDAEDESGVGGCKTRVRLLDQGTVGATQIPLYVV
jgi:hypothetical protein